jgi:DNA-binding NarL/FixJ family response regulator
MVAPAVTRRLIAAFAGQSAVQAARAEPPAELATLTPREHEVLASLGGGRSNVEIGAQLGVTEATAKTHVSRILAKLGLRSRVQAAVLAQELGISPPAE